MTPNIAFRDSDAGLVISRARRKLVAQGSLYSVATAAPLLAHALITPLLTRTLGGEEYGEVALFFVLAQTLAIVLGMGLAAALSRHVVLASSGGAGALGQALLVGAGALCLFLASVVAAVLLAPLPTLGAVCLALASASMLSAFGAFQAIALGRGQAGRFVTRAFVMALGPPAVGACVVLIVEPLAGLYMSGFVSAQVVIYGGLAISAACRERIELSLAELRQSLGVGLPTVPHQLAGIALPAGLVAASTWLIGPSSAGGAQLAILVGTLPIVIVGALNNSWAIQAYATPADARGVYVAETAKFVALIAAVLSIGVALAAPAAIAWLMDPSMDRVEAVTIAQMLCAAAPIFVVYLANIHHVFAEGRTTGLAITSPLSASTALAVGLVLLDSTDAGLQFAVPAVYGVFYLLQSWSSRWLRRRAGLMRLNLTVPWLTALGVAMVVALTVVIAPPLPYATGLALLLAATTLMALPRLVRK